MKITALFIVCIVCFATGLLSFNDGTGCRHQQTTLTDRMTVGNSIIRVYCDDATGRFTIGSANGTTALLEGFPTTNSTSYSGFYINGQYYANMAVPGATEVYADTTMMIAGSIGSKFIIDSVFVTQKLTPVEIMGTGFIRIEFSILNNATTNRNIGIRLLLNTIVGTADSVWALTETQCNTLSRDFSNGNMPDTWQLISASTQIDAIAKGDLNNFGATPPDYFAIADYNDIFALSWGSPATTGSNYSNCAAMLDWNEVTIAPEAFLEIHTYYGFGGASLSNGAVKLIAVSPEELSEFEGHLAPNPFTVTAVAQYMNPGTVTGLSATLALPGGFTIVEGSVTQPFTPASIDSLETAVSVWQVESENPANTQQFSYTLTVESDNAATNFLSRNIIVPHVVAGIWEEDFDSISFPPENWIIDDSTIWTRFNGNNDLYPFNDIDITNVYSALCPWNDGVWQNEWLVSPEFALSRQAGILNFWVFYNSDYVNHAALKVHVSSNSGNDWTEAWSAPDDGLGIRWRQTSVDLTGYFGGEHMRIAWQYVGINGDLVAIDEISLEGVGNENETSPAASGLMMCNFPNPFNPVTTISFYLPEATQNCTLEVFNIRGEKTAVILTQPLEAGRHQKVWNGRNKDNRQVASGIYFFRLCTDRQTLVNKAMLLK
ncbi:MAG: choice-of-anchor J domain-containing protein [Candidatus Cloacimonetes bacterium]|nr:choice-of-anchor J domain-containing protein [Candidatus Cloacimonadota bacterium]